MENEARKLELSTKMLHMGKSLIQEGHTLEDYTISQSGSIMLLVSSLLLSNEDMFMFSEICSMFSAKKILDANEGIDDSDIVNELFNKKQSEIERKKVEKTLKTKRPRRNKDNDSDSEK
jgi:hypothetical protein